MKRESARTQYATHEAKELFRIRNSFSFRLILAMGWLVKNPLRIFLLPFSIAKGLASRNPKIPSLPELSDDSIVILGVDTKGTVWSERATNLSLELQRFDSNIRISLLTTGNDLIEDRTGKLLQYRIPRPRSIDSGRKDWNLTCRRLLSMVLHLQQASRVVYLGDYLYSGIRHSVNSYDSGLHLHWIHSGFTDISGLEDISVKSTASEYKESISKLQQPNKVSKSTVQDFLPEIPEGAALAHLQLTSLGFDLWGDLLESSIAKWHSERRLVTISNDNFSLSVTNTLPGDAKTFSMHGFHFRIIDDDPTSISQINSDSIPAIVLRTGRSLDKISNKVLEELERTGVVIVLRKPKSVTLSDAMKTLCDDEYRMRMANKRVVPKNNLAKEFHWAASMHSLIMDN
ncbi:MAG: hypothetical protein ACPHDO_05330 [Candidatus Poseidoniaceae archaeon]